MLKALGIMTLILAAQTASAMHAYGDDSCVAMTPRGQQISIKLSNTGPLDPHMIESTGLNLKIDEMLWVNFGSANLGVDEPVKTASLSLKVLSETKTSEGKLDDGCFQGDRSTSVRSTVVVNASKRVQDLFDLRNGDRLTFSCYIDFQAPTGAHCN